MARWNQKDRRPVDVSVEEDAPQPGATVGERRQHRRLDASDSVEIAADQRGEVRVGLGNRTEYLPTSSQRLDIADPDFQVPLAVLATADKSRIQSHRDRLGWSCRLNCRRRR
jgi:hypothetical protein